MAQIKLTSADFAATAVGYLPAVPGAVYWNFFGGAVENTARNLAVGGTAGRVTGDPIVSDHSVRLVHGQDYIDTRIAQSTGDTTLVAVAQMLDDDGQDAFIISTNGSANLTDGAGTTTGVSLYVENGAAGDNTLALRGGAEKTAGGFEEASIGGFTYPQTHPRLVAFRYDAATGERRVQDLTGGLSNTNTDATGILQGETFWLGGKRSGTAGQFDLYAAMIWQRRLSDAEIATLETSVRSHYAARGVTV